MIPEGGKLSGSEHHPPDMGARTYCTVSGLVQDGCHVEELFRESIRLAVSVDDPRLCLAFVPELGCGR